MGEAFLDYKKGGSGLDINGIIEDYYVYAGTNVNAGDFVEFVNGVAGQTTETSINKAISSTNLYGGKLSACKLTNNTVFIAHGTNSEDASGNKLIGVVCTISGTTITAGTHTQLSTRNWAGSRISLVALSSTKVFIAHSYGSSTASYTLYGLVCDISGTTITTGSDVSVVNTNYSGYAMSVTRLSSTKVFIAYCNNSSSRYLYGIVCTVSDTTIAQGTKTELNGDTTYTGSCVSATTLSSTKVFIAHSYSTSGYLYGMVCIISDTTITHGTDTALVTENTGFHISAVALSSTKVFIAHALVNNYLWGIVCTISDATITKGTDTLLKDSLHSAYTLFVSKYTSDSALILHGTSDTASSSYLYGMICPVSGTTITAGADVKISDVAYSGAVFSSVFLDSEKLFVAHSGTSNYVMWGRMLKAENNALTNQFTTTTYETQVRPATSLPCKGVAKTSGVGGDSTGHKDIVSIYTVGTEEPDVPDEPTEQLIEFTACPFPDFTADTATNEYGTWATSASSKRSSTYAPYNAFDIDSGSLWGSGILDTGETAYVQLDFPQEVRIKPTTVVMTYASCGAGSCVQGYNPDTGEWVTIGNTGKLATSDSIESFSYTGSIYFSAIRAYVCKYSSNNYAYVSNLKITAGTLKITN